MNLYYDSSVPRCPNCGEDHAPLEEDTLVPIVVVQAQQIGVSPTFGRDFAVVHLGSAQDPGRPVFLINEIGDIRTHSEERDGPVCVREGVKLAGLEHHSIIGLN